MLILNLFIWFWKRLAKFSFHSLKSVHHLEPSFINICEQDCWIESTEWNEVEADKWKLKYEGIIYQTIWGSRTFYLGRIQCYNNDYP